MENTNYIPYNQNKPFFHEHIIKQLPYDKAIYLIFDSTRFDAFNLIFSNGQAREFTLLYQGTVLQDQLEISPIIVRYDLFLQHNYEKWQHYAVAFSTTTNLMDTVNHLKSLIHCELPNMQPAFFRFYAQSWLVPLIKGLTEETLSEFTGPIDNWYVPVDDGKWQQLRILNQTTSKKAADTGWFKLNEDLQVKLANYSYQQFIDQLTLRYSDSPLNTQEGLYFRSIIEKHVKQAKNYGIEQQDHITQYIDLTLCYSSSIQDYRAIEILDNHYDTPSNKLEKLSHCLRDLDAVLAVSNEEKDNSHKSDKHLTS